jgi:hypothetical protein
LPFSSVLHREKTREDWLVAFKAANPAAIEVPEISYENGWWRFKYQQGYVAKHRQAEVELMTRRLWARVAATVNYS